MVVSADYLQFEATNFCTLPFRSLSSRNTKSLLHDRDTSPSHARNEPSAMIHHAVSSAHHQNIGHPYVARHRRISADKTTRQNGQELGPNFVWDERLVNGPIRKWRIQLSHPCGSVMRNSPSILWCVGTQGQGVACVYSLANPTELQRLRTCLQ